jgi:hypothetical protein
MKRLDPKRKYDCERCGAASANDQVVFLGVELCPKCVLVVQGWVYRYGEEATLRLLIRK